jgi:hypothetical protein
METNKNNNQELDIEQLVRSLEHEDTRNLGMTLRFKWIMFIMAPFYFLIFTGRIILEPYKLDQLGFLFFSLGFVGFALLFRSLHQEYKSVDYGISTVEMLTKAANRYRLWQRKTYLTIVPVILICFATSFSLEHLIPNPDQTTRLLIVFFGYLVTLCLAFFIGYIVWSKRQKPLRDKALALLAEMEK